MLLVVLFEVLLGGLWIFLFVDIINCIDVKFSLEVIDYLFCLLFIYFDNCWVGDLVGRIGELVNIWNFLIGIVLIVVLDVVFLVIYIVVMLVFNLLMMVVVLVGLFFFVGIILINFFIVRRLLWKKVECYVDF